jgi:hypothetical protein
MVVPLVAGGAAVDERTADGRTALHMAAREGHVAVIGQLLGQGADIDAKDGDGRTPAGVAAYASNDFALEFLTMHGATGAPQPGEWVDLLKLVDPARDAVAGTWTVRDGELISDDTGAARISFPYETPAEYDFEIDFAVSSPIGCTAQLVSHGETPFAWNMNAGRDPHCRIEDINGHAGVGNPTLTTYYFEAGLRRISVVKVRKGSVTCLINGEVVAEHKTDYSDLSRNKGWTMPNQLLLGVGTWNGPTTFHRIGVRPVQ